MDAPILSRFCVLADTSNREQETLRSWVLVKDAAEQYRP
jgi:hypothetical protein